ncbi:type II toxin-antitoxin system RelE/ParE family toxin [Bosea sp. PAMC 26642]|uniref:type II toxin-antitoxin system RelE/ParE family toxin n=1 Tax=Bosea sp. (strain PAMC 26642) TaxID=1792307 RepID=UPI00077045CC|nr:type II toxin-antitoxin system RelE/ParE family toxin [Bosea sp. PAMC 26642]AMJ60788.1 plasmid stabilization protein [Bosea sp. PAMC 26642]
MTRYGLSKRATDDLYQIFLYGYEQFGVAQAEAYAERLHHVFQLLADSPHMGRAASMIGEGVRRHEHGAHIVLYRPSRDGVSILRIVHNRSMSRLKL